MSLTSTIRNEDHILWPEQEVVFTCETRGLVLQWISDNYIGEGGISLEFYVSICNLGDTITTLTGSTAILSNVDHSMVSEFHIKTSPQFPTSTVGCTNFNETSKYITFSVLGMCISIIFLLHIFWNTT